MDGNSFRIEYVCVLGLLLGTYDGCVLGHKDGALDGDVLGS